MEQFRGDLGETFVASSSELHLAPSREAAFTAVVLAGSRCGEDTFASQFGQKYKALVPLCGQPMILRVLKALEQSHCVNRIVIVFNCIDSLYESCPELKAICSTERVTVIPCENSICDSVFAGLEAVGGDGPFLVTTADHALLTPAMIETFCTNARNRGNDLAVGLVEKAYLDREHPKSCRTYLPFKGSKLSGANMFAFLTPASKSILPFWKMVEQKRKKPWKLFSAFGWRNLLGLLLKRYTVEEAFQKASRVVGVKTVAIQLPFAEAAIDVDTALDHEEVSKILELRESAAI